MLETPQVSYARCFLPSYHCDNVPEGRSRSLGALLAARHDCSGDDWDSYSVCLLAALEAWRCMLCKLCRHIVYAVRSVLYCMLGTHAVVSMSLSEAGDLLAVLSNSTAYAYQPGMETWMCVVDSAFAQTSYSSIMTSGMPGKKEILHNAKEPRTHL